VRLNVAPTSPPIAPWTTDQPVSGFQDRFGTPSVSQMQLRCPTLVTGGLKVGAGTGALATAIGAGTTGTVRALEECGSGYAAYGLYGYSNTALNASGLLCRRAVDAILVKKPGTVAPRSMVRYGTSTTGAFVDQMVSGTIAATHAFFGSDPAPGSAKKVWLRGSTP
jgi:hypothetical protein